MKASGTLIRMRKHAFAAVIALSVGAGTVALTHAWRSAVSDPSRKPVIGIVVTPPEGRSVRIAHDEIAGYMAAMTMAFTLADGESTALKPGDRVRFTLRV